MDAAHPRAPRPDHPRPDQLRRGPLTRAQRDAIRAAVAALPPLTDEQIDSLCEVINNYRARRRRAPAPTNPTRDPGQAVRVIKRTAAPRAGGRAGVGAGVGWGPA
jgi:hypothetical protein